MRKATRRWKNSSRKRIRRPSGGKHQSTTPSLPITLFLRKRDSKYQFHPAGGRMGPGALAGANYTFPQRGNATNPFLSFWRILIYWRFGKWDSKDQFQPAGGASSRTSYRSRQRILFQSKCCRSFTPSLLLSKSNPLRWASIWSFGI